MHHNDMASEAACIDVEPLVFDNYDEPKTALKYCAVCPVRDWCLKQVEPIESMFDGIAGGHVWKDGTHRQGNLKDPVLRDYVKQSRHRLKRSEQPKKTEQVDRVALSQFLAGRIPHTALTAHERTLAAAWLIGEGWTEEDAVMRCHVSSRAVRSQARRR